MYGVYEYLRGWVLPELIPTFEEQQIDVDVSENLNDEDIKELIPVLGHRKKFLKKYNEFKSVQEALLHPAIMENSLKDDNFSGKSDVSCETWYDSDSTITNLSDISQNTSVSTSDLVENNLTPLRYYSEKATVGEPYEMKETSPSNSVKHLLRNDLSRMIVKNELMKSSDKKMYRKIQRDGKRGV
ncbi:hypothetical protein JTB14_012771 [Gonioctena quinquepunctata]|nr:hypothetical protein JTB14_012771 [Gonioctena quinquepunctata]